MNDVFDQLTALPGLDRLLGLVWNTFGVNPALVSPDGRRVVTFGRELRAQPFCEALQARAGGREICGMCDRSRFLEARRDGQALRYRCHAGLTEFIVPVIREGEVVAMLQCGQVHDRAPTDEEWGRSRLGLLAAGISEEGLAGLYRRNRQLSPERQDDLLDLLDLVAARLGAADHQPWRATAGRSQVCLGKAMTFIESHLAEPITLDEVARAAGLSSRTLMRLFRKEVHGSVVEYVQRRRVARARQLLRIPGHTCAEVAFACGFGSVQHFNRVFRRHEQLSPTQWRAWENGVNSHGPVDLITPWTPNP